MARCCALIEENNMSEKDPLKEKLTDLLKERSANSKPIEEKICRATLDLLFDYVGEERTLLELRDFALIKANRGNGKMRRWQKCGNSLQTNLNKPLLLWSNSHERNQTQTGGALLARLN
jgi:hypothetical protein